MEVAREELLRAFVRIASEGGNELLQVITVFPGYQGYDDEFDTFAQLGQRVTKHHIVTKPFDLETKRRLVEESAGRIEWHLLNARGLKFFLNARRIVNDILARCESYPVVVHTHFQALPGLRTEPHVRRHIRAVQVLSLYSNDLLFIRERRWHPADDIDLRLSWQYVARHVGMYSGRALRQGVSTRMVSAVHGVSAEVFRQEGLLFRFPSLRLVYPTPVNPQRWYEEVAYKRSRERLLFVGRTQPWKGVATVVETIRALRAEGRSVVLDIVGSSRPEEKVALGRRIAKLGLAGSVNWVGQVNRLELRRLYAQAGVMVFPSWHEGSPRVVREALLCGCPVVARDIPGARFAGKYRLLNLVSGGALRDWVEATRRVLDVSEQERRRLASEDRAELVARFSPNAAAEEWMGFYHEVLSGREARANRTALV